MSQEPYFATIQAHDEAVLDFYRLCHAEHSAVLQGKSYDRYDGRGFNVLSLAWGRVEAYRHLCPYLAKEHIDLNGVKVAPDALSIKDAARADALAADDKARYDEWVLRRQLERKERAA